MSKGPIINNVTKNFTTRDSLGIEGVATSIASEICPIVNTVTPRPFYWAFITWCYYDFYRNCNPKDRTNENVKDYIKRQNYFLALGSLLAGNQEVGGFTGTQNIIQNTGMEKNFFEYNEKYLKNKLSNMGYYLSGITTMNFLVEKDKETNEQYKYPKLTPEGKKLAISFDNIISKSKYYQNRVTGLEFSREDLIDLGNIVRINLDGFDETKSILSNHLFNMKSTSQLREDYNYLKFLYEKYNIKNLDLSKCRELFYDYFSIRGNNYKYPVELKEIINSWEIVIARQYFTVGLEMIWKFMLENLETSKEEIKWFNDCFNNSKFKFDLNGNVSSIIDECKYTFSDREELIYMASKNGDHSSNIENGIRIIISIFNRIVNRDDLTYRVKNFYDYGIERGSISLNEFIEKVQEYNDKSIKDFIVYIMHNYLLIQHLNTAFEKMMDGRNGYYLEKIDEKYIVREQFDIAFQGIRMVQLLSVMRDLRELEG